jgi:hypothetical protein
MRRSDIILDTTTAIIFSFIGEHIAYHAKQAQAVSMS